MLELLKIIVQPVALERDENGKIVGEQLGEKTALYSFEELIEFRRMVEQSLTAQQGNGSTADIPKGEPSGVE